MNLEHLRMLVHYVRWNMNQFFQISDVDIVMGFPLRLTVPGEEMLPFSEMEGTPAGEDFKKRQKAAA